MGLILWLCFFRYKTCLISLWLNRQSVPKLTLFMIISGEIIGVSTLKYRPNWTSPRDFNSSGYQAPSPMNLGTGTNPRIYYPQHHGFLTMPPGQKNRPYVPRTEPTFTFFRNFVQFFDIFVYNVIMF